MSDHGDDTKKSRFEGVLPEILKRAVELGKERAHEAPENLRNFVGDKIPKEVSSYVFHQVDETKNGLLKVVASEVRSFLEATNLSHELQKLLTTVKFEIHTTIRFSPNEDRPKKKKPERSPEGRSEGPTEHPDEIEPGHGRGGREEETSSARSERQAAPEPENESDRKKDDDDGGLHIELRSGELPKIRRG